MKQVFRRVIDKQGKIVVEEIPVPVISDIEILISNRFSVISSGTETSTIQKTAPNLVMQTLKDPWLRNAVKTTVLSGGIKATAERIFEEIKSLRAVGYSGAGIVIEKGALVEGIEVGDKVAYAAQGHAEVVKVPKNLFVKVPDEVNLMEAAFVTLGGIAIQGVRRAQMQFGETVAVIGLGLVGQLVCQVLNAAGMVVIGIDVEAGRIELARSLGLKKGINAAQSDPVKEVLDYTHGIGSDAVIICAASKESQIANQALKMARKQGRVVVIGIVGMDLERMPFFLNELDLVFSRAYGPGSYDKDYEEKGIDYPIGYVRWTEERNMGEFIRLLAEKKISVKPMISKVFPIEEAQKAYDLVRNPEREQVAVLLSYNKDETKEPVRKITLNNHKDCSLPHSEIRADKINVGMIGCGNFARSYHLPNLKKISGYHLKAVASASGTSALASAKKYDVEYYTTDYQEILADDSIDLVIIATRHNLHAPIAIAAAKAKKHIFCEKPMAMSLDELKEIVKAVQENDVMYTVGYNRRFVPLTVKAKSFITEKPLIINYTVNVKVKPDHWTLDVVEGGGRIIAECEHFFDLFYYFIEAEPIELFAQCILSDEENLITQCNFTVTLKFADGSLGSLTYTNKGHPAFPREKIEIFSGNSVIMMDDFRQLTVKGRKRKKMKHKMDMGHLAELEHFLQALQGETSNQAVSLIDGVRASLCSLKTLESLKSQTNVEVEVKSMFTDTASE